MEVGCVSEVMDPDGDVWCLYVVFLLIRWKVVNIMVRMYRIKEFLILMVTYGVSK